MGKLDIANPCAKVRKHNVKHFQPNPINEKEIEELVKHISKDVRACVVLGFYTELRRQELLGLSWEHIDFDKKTIFIPKTKTEKERTIGITTDLAKLLKSLNPAQSGYVFNNVTGDKLNIS